MSTLSNLKNNFGIGKWQLKFGRINTNTSGQTHSENPKRETIYQQDLAAKCNFEKSNMSRLEAGRTNATLSTLEIVSKALEINTIELFKFND